MHVLKLVAIALAGVWSVEFAVCVAVLGPVAVKARSDRAQTSSAAAFRVPAADGNEVTESGVSAPLTAS
jgi:hypothetical protein